MDGLTIVVSGQFDQISRPKLEQLIAEYGGKCTGSVSGKTDYLVVGYKLEDGREVTQGGKYKNALAKGKTIMNEQEFEQFMKEKTGNADYTLAKKLDLAPIAEAEETEIGNKDSAN